MSQIIDELEHFKYLTVMQQRVDFFETSQTDT